jgi:hypothetical protein
MHWRWHCRSGSISNWRYRVAEAIRKSRAIDAELDAIGARLIAINAMH